MGIDFLSRFEENHYTPRLKSLFDSTMEYISSHVDEIERAFSRAIDAVCDEATKAQEAGMLPEVSYISISFLYTSFYLGKPQFQIDCYPEGWFLAESMCSARFDAAWVTRFVEGFREDLINDSKKDGTIRVVPPEEINVFVLRAVRDLLFYVVNVIKYFPKMHAFPKLFRMAKGESFYMTFGELGDWQRAIYAVLPKVDIFNCDKDTILRFRSFPAIYYHDKEFAELDLTHSVFRDCTFIDCDISACIWNDCLFDNCTFKNISIKESSFLGTVFFQCKLDGISFERDTFHQVLGDSDKEFYKDAMFSYCSLSHSVFTDCDLEKCVFNKCDCKAVEVVDRNMENAPFSAFIQASDAEGGE